MNRFRRHEERKADKLAELIERYLSEYVDAKLPIEGHNKAIYDFG